MFDISARSILLFSMCMLFVLSPVTILAKKKEKEDDTIKIIMKYDGDELIQEKLDKLAENIVNTAKEFNTANQVAYWDNEGKNLILKRLQSEGYYNPIISSITEHEVANKGYSITFDISPSNQYIISAIEVVHSENSNKDISLPTIDSLSTKINEPARAEGLLDNQAEILTKIEEDNCLLYVRIHNEATIDHKNDTVSIKYIVDAGPVAAISKVDFEGMTTVKKAFLEKVVELKEGPCFKRSKILAARETLQTTGLFASTTPNIPNEVDKEGKVPVIFQLKERKHRSIKAGVSYGKDLGLGLNGGWEHRNFFSNGEEVAIKAFVNEKEQFGSLSYIEPYFLRNDQKLIGTLSADNSTLRAFDSREGKFYLGLEREMIDNVDAGFGGKVTVSRIKEKADDDRLKKQGENFVLLSVPVYVSFDRRDNVVDAHKGYYLRGEIEPFYDVNRNDNIFMKNTIQARYYTKLNFHKKSVVAMRARMGSILGENASKIPATERFYVGGDGSVRGYAYQTVGPQDKNRKVPLGGMSSLETSIEYRYMREDNIGMVLFYDAGNVYRKHIPDFRKRKFFSAGGFGFRYNTDFGPIRADIAFPFKRRKGIDDPFQFYFGIGQSF